MLLSADLEKKNEESLAPLVLIVINAGWFLRSHFMPLMRSIQACGARVEVAIPSSPESSLLRSEGFIVHDIPLARIGTRAVHEVRLIAALRNLYLLRRPSVVHHFTIKPMLFGTIAARLARVPRIVNSVTGLGYLFVSSGWRGAPIRALIHLLYRVSFSHPSIQVLFENPDDQALFERLGLVAANQSRVVGGAGVDVRVFHFMEAPDPTAVPIVLLPARLLWDKGIGEFVDAARILRSQGIRARFAIAGGLDVNPASIPRTRIDEWVADESIEWWGRRTDMPTALASASIVALPSYREGCPKALLEAAAIGRPIVTTDVPGCRQVVTHGRNGFLVPSHDPGALADALRILLADNAMRRRMGRESRLLAEARFSDSLVARQMIAAYEPMLRSASATLKVPQESPS